MQHLVMRQYVACYEQNLRKIANCMRKEDESTSAENRNNL